MASWVGGFGSRCGLAAGAGPGSGVGMGLGLALGSGCGSESVGRWVGEPLGPRTLFNTSAISAELTCGAWDCRAKSSKVPRGD